MSNYLRTHYPRHHEMSEKRPRRYQVAVDVLHTQGALAGITSPHGHRVTFPTLQRARRHARFLGRVRDVGDSFLGTVPVGDVQITRLT